MKEFIDKILAIFSKKPSLSRMKIMLFPILIFGLLKDYSVFIDADERIFNLTPSEFGVIKILVLLVFFILLFVVDVWENWFDRSFKLKILKDENIPISLKNDIIQKV